VLSATVATVDSALWGKWSQSRSGPCGQVRSGVHFGLLGRHTGPGGQVGEWRDVAEVEVANDPVPDPGPGLRDQVGGEVDGGRSDCAHALPTVDSRGVLVPTLVVAETSHVADLEQ